MKDMNFTLLPAIVKPNGKEYLLKEDDEMLIEIFDSGSENNFDVICNVVSMLPIEYNTITKVKEEENEVAEESANHKPLCDYVMNNSCVDEDKAIFERLDLVMQQH